MGKGERLGFYSRVGWMGWDRRLQVGLGGGRLAVGAGVEGRVMWYLGS